MAGRPRKEKKFHPPITPELQALYPLVRWQKVWATGDWVLRDYGDGGGKAVEGSSVKYWYGKEPAKLAEIEAQKAVQELRFLAGVIG